MKKGLHQKADCIGSFSSNDSIFHCLWKQQQAMVQKPCPVLRQRKEIRSGMQCGQIPCMYPTGVHAAGVLVYRTDVYSEEDAPKTFAELTDAKYANQVGMADPGVAAPAYPLAAYFMDSLGLDGGTGSCIGYRLYFCMEPEMA